MSGNEVQPEICVIYLCRVGKIAHVKLSPRYPPSDKETPIRVRAAK